MSLSEQLTGLLAIRSRDLVGVIREQYFGRSDVS
jgi:hypothetical protein